MKIYHPCSITSRLLPGIKLSTGTISIEYSERAGRESRTRYQYHIDIDGMPEFTDDDLESGCQGGSLNKGLASLLSFMSSAAESYSFQQRNDVSWNESEEMWPENITEWLDSVSDELSMAAYELEESNCIVE